MFNKTISTPIAITIILGAAIVVAGLVVWQSINLKPTNQNLVGLQPQRQSKTEEPKIEEQKIEEQIDTSNWKTYYSEKFGFEIKYPPIYTLHPELLGETGRFFFYNIKRTAGAMMEVSVAPTNAKSISGIILPNSEIIKISNYKMLKTPSDYGGNAYFLVFDGNLYRFDFSRAYVENEDKDEEEKMFIGLPKILETLSLIKKVSLKTEARGVLGYDHLLEKMFPNNKAENGAISLHRGRSLALSQVKEGAFSHSQAKEKLLIVRMGGTSHVEGLYHAFLGVFDSKDNLLTSQFFDPVTLEGSFKEGHFFADFGQFAFYHCEKDGKDRILFVGAKQPNIPIRTPDSARLFILENNEFKVTYEIDPNTEIGFGINPSWGEIIPSPPVILKPKKDRILVYKQGFKDYIPTPEEFRSGKFPPQEIYSHSLYWDSSECKFERKI